MALCAACLGRSAGQSFCDGLHKETELTTVVFEPEHDGTADLCGCQSSQGRPFCDGSRDLL